MTDIVETVAESETLSRPPLVIVGRVRTFPDVHGLGAGPIRTVTRIGEDRDHDARLFADSGADAIRTVNREGRQGSGHPLWSLHDPRRRRISLLRL